jgi:hypothetical protein
MSLVGIALYVKTQVLGLWLSEEKMSFVGHSPVPEDPGTRCLAQGRE